MSTAAKPVWVTATVLSTLANQGLGKTGATFVCADLAGWTSDLLNTDQRTHASSQLIKLGFITYKHITAGMGVRQVRYTVTKEGAQAIQAAGMGQVRKSGPKGSRRPNPLPRDSMAARLWQLLRMRRILDSDSAAQTLCDAGDQDFKSVRSTVRKYLKRWADADALKVAAKRVGVGAHYGSNGLKRYILKDEWASQPEPPAWRQIAKARAKVEASS